MSTPNRSPLELSNGQLVCQPHRLTICGKCCVDYSFMDDIESDSNDNVDSDDEKPLTEEEMKAFREKLIAKKGCACFLPIVGNGCKNCDARSAERENVEGASISGKQGSSDGQAKSGGASGVKKGNS